MRNRLFNDKQNVSPSYTKNRLSNYTKNLCQRNMHQTSFSSIYKIYLSTISLIFFFTLYKNYEWTISYIILLIIFKIYEWYSEADPHLYFVRRFVTCELIFTYNGSLREGCKFNIFSFLLPLTPITSEPLWNSYKHIWSSAWSSIIIGSSSSLAYA